MVNYTADNQVI